jgi:hypothetical protein
MTSNSNKKYFYLGTTAGIVGGVLANLFVAFMMKFIDLSGPQPAWAIIIEFLIVISAFFAVIWLLFREIEKLKDE